MTIWIEKTADAHSVHQYIPRMFTSTQSVKVSFFAILYLQLSYSAAFFRYIVLIVELLVLSFFSILYLQLSYSAVFFSILYLQFSYYSAVLQSMFYLQLDCHAVFFLCLFCASFFPVEMNPGKRKQHHYIACYTHSHY